MVKKPNKQSKRNIKQRIRFETLKYFYKRGQCEFCKECGTHTTFHHKRYVLPPKLKRSDLIELCEKCHIELEKELKEKMLRGNMPPRELR